jgi:DNA-binding transcriptional ArsR family regulator
MCYVLLTHERKRVNEDEFAARLAAIASPQRIRILAELTGGQLHVSELARRVEMSRALLYMHLTKLEEAGFVTGHLELGADGKALKFFEAIPFTITIDLQTLAEAAKRGNHSWPSTGTSSSG